MTETCNNCQSEYDTNQSGDYIDDDTYDMFESWYKDIGFSRAEVNKLSGRNYCDHECQVSALLATRNGGMR
jgi:hypothetical protein